MGVKSLIVEPEKAIKEIKTQGPKGIIFSGGPSSVYATNSPTIDKEIFNFHLPILGICYGQQLLGLLLGGKIKSGKIKEYGPALISILKSPLFKNIQTPRFQVWMSHGDEIVVLPKGFTIIAQSENIKAAAISDEKRKIYAVQFHPEVQHTKYGNEILKNFLNICDEKPDISEINIGKIIEGIKETVGDKKVIMAFSGGTDSFVAGVLIARAIGKQMIPVYVDSGLMREDSLNNVKKIFPKITHIQPKVLKARKIFLQKLRGIIDPETKRKTIGKLYVDLFNEIAEKQKGVKFLGQGTTYADFIHSKGTKYSALIKSHHNVGGLPKKMKLKLLEPVRYFYTDQIRQIGKKLNLPKEVIYQQPFPGPGFAVRILGEVTEERLSRLKIADQIVVNEINKAGLKDEIFQYFAILTNTKSTAIKGDGRFYGEIIAIRAYTTKDRMTADWAKIPYNILQKISTRIVNEVPDVSRVVYDITTKPPATMEWE